MAIYYCKKTRRQFLVGTGKSLLALPLLPSLLPRKAWAQSANVPPRMMIFWYDHNNMNAMWPSPNQANVSFGNMGAREVMLSALGTMASHSPALDNQQYESLKNANLVTIIRGLDIQHGAGHGNGGMAAAQDRESEGGCPTIDTVIEASSAVYPVGTPLAVRRAMRIQISNGASPYFRKVGTGVQQVPAYNERQLLNFYNEVFGSLTQGTVPQQDMTNQLKSNILNRVHGSFQQFRTSAKISADDRARLDQHMDFISDLQRNLANNQTITITCDQPPSPGNLSYSGNENLVNRTYMDLLAVAFRCGLSKFGVMKFEGHNPQWIPGIGANGVNIHDIMHGASGGATQLTVKTNFWRYYSDIIADRFIAPLTEMEGDTGQSYIENMATVLMCQGGFANPGGDGGHNGLDSQQVILGSMAGKIRAGRYMLVPRSQTGDQIFRGSNVPYNRFLITLLQLMGVPRAEYEAVTPGGQGFGFYGAFQNNYPRRDQFFDPIDQLMA